jgi:hypothetical protein
MARGAGSPPGIANVRLYDDRFNPVYFGGVS